MEFTLPSEGNISHRGEAKHFGTVCSFVAVGIEVRKHSQPEEKVIFATRFGERWRGQRC